MNPNERPADPVVDTEVRRQIHEAADAHFKSREVRAPDGFAAGGLVRGAGGLLYPRTAGGSGARALGRWPVDPRASSAIAALKERDTRQLERRAVRRAVEWVFARARALGGIEHVDARKLPLELYP